MMDVYSYPEWMHRQCCNLAYQRTPVRAPVAAASLAICGSHLHGAIRGAQGLLPLQGGVVTASQLDLPSLTDCNFKHSIGLLQQHYCKQLINDPTFRGSRFSTGRLVAIEDYIFYRVHLLLPGQPQVPLIISDIICINVRIVFSQQFTTLISANLCLSQYNKLSYIETF